LSAVDRPESDVPAGVPGQSAETRLALSLLSAAAVRERAHLLLAEGLAGRLEHFCVDLSHLDYAADLTAQVTREAYPTLDIPLHARWRHFVLDGDDRWSTAARTAQWADKAARARAEFDLAIISVLTDAGAGPQWRYHNAASGRDLGRSEGLAIAGLAMFVAGLFSGHPRDPLRADAAKLYELAEATLANGFQAGPRNPLIGVAGRTRLLRRLGEVVAASPAVFSRNDGPRPGGLFDHVAALAPECRIAAPKVLEEVLRHLGPVWPSPITLGGIGLGDCWRHPAIRRDDPSNQLVPLHKLSQWLTYSLIEPLERAGIAVTDPNGLTGLAEYRNGGLFIDSGVLAPRDPEAVRQHHDIGAPLVVEWRALTVALIDHLADPVRHRLGCDAKALPLAKILQGGSWAAGRLLALRLRPDGAPPLQVISEGTVF
jgi:hypothetical protein